MKSLVIAVDLKIIVSLNCLKANKAKIKYDARQDRTTSCTDCPSYFVDWKFAEIRYVLAYVWVSEQTWELCKVLTRSTKKKKLLLERFLVQGFYL